MTKKKNELWEWTKALLIAVALAAVIRYFLFAPIVVDGLSMMPTLHDQDRMIVNKLSYEIGTPHRFDIIVFHAPEGKDYIKRVIGLPGDRIEYKNDTLYVNGKAYKEPYLDEYKKQLVDIIFELVDARIPYSSRNPMIDEIIQHKKRLVLLNKADMADKERTKEWIQFFAGKGVKALAINAQAGEGLRDIVQASHQLLQ